MQESITLRLFQAHNKLRGFDKDQGDKGMQKLATLSNPPARDTGPHQFTQCLVYCLDDLAGEHDVREAVLALDEIELSIGPIAHV
jgi:hypothetical protein